MGSEAIYTTSISSGRAYCSLRKVTNFVVETPDNHEFAWGGSTITGLWIAPFQDKLREAAPTAYVPKINMDCQSFTHVGICNAFSTHCAIAPEMIPFGLLAMIYSIVCHLLGRNSLMDSLPHIRNRDSLKAPGNINMNWLRPLEDLPRTSAIR
jgi:hypothetical protein